MARPPARNTFLAHTLLRAVCPPPPWAEIIGLSWYDPDTGQASPPDFPEAPGGGHNIHLDILDVTTAPVTVHHIGPTICTLILHHAIKDQR